MQLWFAVDVFGVAELVGIAIFRQSLKRVGCRIESLEYTCF